jgi:hypothetical protein
MGSLSTELITQLVKATNDRNSKNQDYTVYGTIKSDGDRNYVVLDGSNVSTPIESTVEIHKDDRVVVEVKNHTATVTGNISDPAIGTKTADGIRSSITQTASQIRLEVADEVSKIQSSITQTASEIRLEVSNSISGLQSSIKQNTDSILSVVQEQSEFSEFKQTVEGFSFMSKGGTVKISGGDINLTGAISFSDLSDSSDIQDQIDTAQSDADAAWSRATTAKNAADSVDEVLTALLSTTDKTTYIDGSKIVTESLYVDKIKLGEMMTVYKELSGTAAGGYLGYDSGFNSSSGIGVRDSTERSQMVCSNNAARISYGNPDEDTNFAQVIVNSNGRAYIEASAYISFGIGDSYFLQLTDHTNYGSFRPHNDAPYTMNLGNTNFRWGALYATNGTIQTSDRNYKNNIESLPEKYITLFDNLKPMRFKMNEGTSDRYHVGYIAQEVEEAMIAAGIDGKEFGGFVKDKDEDGNDVLMLRYGEFDAIYAAKIKQLETRLIALEKGER